MRRIAIVIVFIFLLSGGKLWGKRWEADRWIAPAWNTHEIAFDAKGNAYMVWSPVCFTRSTDGGATWSPVTLIEDWDYLAGNPDIKVDSKGHIYIVYTAQFEGSPTQLYMRKSTDSGISWSDPARIAWTQKGSQWPRILIDSKDGAHVLFQDLPANPGGPDSDSYADFCHVKSSDGGTTWSAATVIDSGIYCWTIDAAIDQLDNIYLFACYAANHNQLPWQSYCLTSRNGGLTWDLTPIGGGNYPSGAVDADGTVHVVYNRDIGNDQSEIEYSRSLDQGRTFSPEQPLTVKLSRQNWNPDWVELACHNGKLYVAYQDSSPGNLEIQMLTSPNRGKTWLKPERLTYTPTPSLQPSLAFDPFGGLHLIWNEITTASFFSELYYKRAFVPASGK